MHPVPVIIDTDPGLGEPGSVIDDGLAIALAVASPELDVLGLTTVNGNVGAATGYTLARELLCRLGRADIPVRLGAASPLRQDMARVWEVFGAEPPTDSATSDAASIDATVPRDAVAWLIEQVAARPGEITIAAIGPVTNLAEAITADPSFARNVKEIVTMAGNATGHVEHIDVVADFNVLVDPEAMDIVLRSGANVRLIGIDQTSRVVLDRADAEWLRSQDHGDAATGPGAGATPTPAASTWLADCVDGWIDVLEAEASHDDPGTALCLLHDPLVVAAIVDPSVCTFAAVGASVDLEAGAIDIVIPEPGSDSTTAITATPAIRAAVDTDVPAFRQLFLSRTATL
ncbi:nucleoside hydrolase [Plantibacter sp. Mn2098]|uniref:nucleoside hydrolase n=1 Tax=Plantibacter sp. Mn2098 TaxID=3395266 RepID=UPI003BE96230